MKLLLTSNIQLNNHDVPHSTQDIPHGTHDIPNDTEHPPPPPPHGTKHTLYGLIVSGSQESSKVKWQTNRQQMDQCFVRHFLSTTKTIDNGQLWYIDF